LVIPQLVVLLFVSLAAVVVLIAGWFSSLVAGRWPQGLRSFVVGWMRWSFRVTGYLWLVVDDYPPFGFDSSAPSEWWRPAPDASPCDADPRSPRPSTPASSGPATTGLEPTLAPGLSETPQQVNLVASSASPETSSSVPPRPPGPSADPCSAIGPPWPRLVGTGSPYTPARLSRWPIVVGTILLFAGLVGQATGATKVWVSGGRTPGSARSVPPYVFTARDAGFTAIFPGEPERIEGTAVTIVGTGPVLLYQSARSDHAIVVAYASVPPSLEISLDGVIAIASTALSDANVVSTTPISYQGQPAEDAVIFFSGGVEHARAVEFGSSVYVLGGLGTSVSTFANDYNVLLSSFRPASTLSSPTP
jgi:hypothetical protein